MKEKRAIIWLVILLVAVPSAVVFPIVRAHVNSGRRNWKTSEFQSRGYTWTIEADPSRGLLNDTKLEFASDGAGWCDLLVYQIDSESGERKMESDMVFGNNGITVGLNCNPTWFTFEETEKYELLGQWGKTENPALLDELNALRKKRTFFGYSSGVGLAATKPYLIRIGWPKDSKEDWDSGERLLALRIEKRWRPFKGVFWYVPASTRTVTR